MDGIIITLKSSTKIREFAEVFSPVSPVLSGYSFITEGWPLRPGVDQSDHDLYTSSLVDSQDEMHSFPPGVLVPKKMASILTDWNSIYGFATPPDVRKFLSRLKAGAGADQFRQQFCSSSREYVDVIARETSAERTVLAELTDVCIFNIDGGIWEFFGRTSELNESIRANAMAAGLEVNNAILERTAW